VKLSIVILCWNDRKVILDCLRSIYSGTHSVSFEAIVSDNGSTDDSVKEIREAFPRTRVLENGRNLRFSKGNNEGIRASSGEFVLILNPDTIIHDGALDSLVAFAETHPEAGAFGCRVVNPDGSYQESGRPFPTVFRSWVAALCLRPLAHLSSVFDSDQYTRWKGDTERQIDWQSGCCVLVRSELLKRLGGFDEQFYYYYEDVDLCKRVWDAGYPVLFTPQAVITHLGGQSTSRRFPLRFELDKYTNRYRYFYKYYGAEGARACRRVTLASLLLRKFGYALVQLMKPSDSLRQRGELFRAAIDWNRSVDPVALVETGKEYTPAATPLGLDQQAPCQRGATRE